VGSVVGSTTGFWIGREIGYRILFRYGPYVGLTERHIKIGQYLFRQHGGKIVFFGRFVPVLRMLAGLLAGVNRMPWAQFLLFNTAGSILWACVYGLGAYYLGEQARSLAGPLQVGFGVVVLVILVGGWILLRRQEAQLAEAAERALPGPLEAPRRRRATDG